MANIQRLRMGRWRYWRPRTGALIRIGLQSLPAQCLTRCGSAGRANPEASFGGSAGAWMRVRISEMRTGSLENVSLERQFSHWPIEQDVK
jgi:hypothetical protein